MFTELLDSTHHHQAAVAIHDSIGVDTLRHAAAAAEHGGGEGNIFTELIHHLYDSRTVEFQPFFHFTFPQFPPVHIFGITVDFSITKHVFYMWIAAAILTIMLVTAARRNTQQRVPHGIGNLIEIIIIFIRDEIVIPTMGHEGMKYISYLLTTFFFIMTMNLLGLIPYGVTPTGNVAVTAGLAIIAFVMIQVAPIRKLGFGKYLAHLTGGVHWALWPIMVPIEIIGMLVKPFALCIRLFANMTGGHLVLVSLVGLIFLFQSYLFSPVSIGFMIGINMLELFVALLQAYVFTMLTAVFMGIGLQSGHEEEHSQ
jgi:F-type H+-transporting ATPase subunit a